MMHNYPDRLPIDISNEKMAYSGRDSSRQVRPFTTKTTNKHKRIEAEGRTISSFFS